jgi:branched-chain amino acid transport system ATP-binding protein
MTESRSDVVLRTRGLTKVFRGFTAVDAVDLEVRRGTVHALVGPNGAGKTTLFNLLSGFLKPTSGTIEHEGRDIAGRQPEEIAHLGIARSFQITSLFDKLTARQHLELALASPTGIGYRFWRSQKQLARFEARARELLDEVGMADQADRAVELALALALDPSLMLLDEPTAGMGVEDVDRTITLIERIAQGRTVVFVDHNMHVVGSLADQVTVLQQGAVLVEGSYDEVRTDPKVITAYLGQSHV